jgi:hypothetical protein
MPETELRNRAQIIQHVYTLDPIMDSFAAEFSFQRAVSDNSCTSLFDVVHLNLVISRCFAFIFE